MIHLFLSSLEVSDLHLRAAKVARFFALLVIPPGQRAKIGSRSSAAVDCNYALYQTPEQAEAEKGRATKRIKQIAALSTNQLEAI